MPDIPPLPPIANQPVSVLLLADNDAAHLETVVAAWLAYFNELGRDYEIILIDDGSTDATPQLTAAPRDRVKILRHETRLGEGAALKSGLAVARFPLLFYTVCDPCYQPADFKRLLEEIDKVHFISGYRGGHPVPGLVVYFESLFSLFVRVVLGSQAPPLPSWLGWKRQIGRLLVRIVFAVRNRDVACPYRLIRREIFARMPVQSKGTFAHAEILAKANFLGCLTGEEVILGSAEQPIPLDERRTDTTGRVLAEAFRLFQNPKFLPPPTEAVPPHATPTNLDDAAARSL